MSSVSKVCLLVLALAVIVNGASITVRGEQKRQHSGRGVFESDRYLNSADSKHSHRHTHKHHHRHHRHDHLHRVSDNIPGCSKRGASRFDIVEPISTAFGKPLDGGSFGQVWAAQDAQGATLAMKQFRDTSTFDFAFIDAIYADVAGTQNIVDYFGMCADKPVRMYFPLLQSIDRSLISLASQQRSNVIRMLKTLTDVSAGYAYMHSKGIVHRDIKVSNLLTSDTRTNDQLAAMTFDQLMKPGAFKTGIVADLDLAVRIPAGSNSYALDPSSHGQDVDMPDLVRRPPELAAFFASSSADAKPTEHAATAVYVNGFADLMKFVGMRAGAPMTTKIDVWYFGGMIREMARNGAGPTKMPGRLVTLFRSCWNDDPAQRPTMASLNSDLRSLLQDVLGSDAFDFQWNTDVPDS